ncbi:MAG: hypothetical protein EOO61_09845, partial [Hymenobacter sp.]
MNTKSSTAITILALAAGLVGCTQKKDVITASGTQVVTDKNWKFETTPMWADEFNGATVDASKWT